jgi:hypothetical protein
VAVLVWIAASLGIVLLLLVAIVVGALVSLIRLEGRVGPEGAWGRGRWGLFGFEVEPAEDRLVLRVLGWRVARTSLRRRAAEPDTDADATPRAKAKAAARAERRARSQLSLASYRRLARTGWRELHRMRRHLHVDRLRLEAVVASDDPALTGEVYGVGCAALGALRGFWPHADVRLEADFVATEPRGAAEAALRLRPVRLVPSVARVGWAYWRERRRSRRRA